MEVFNFFIHEGSDLYTPNYDGMRPYDRLPNKTWKSYLAKCDHEYITNVRNLEGFPAELDDSLIRLFVSVKNTALETYIKQPCLDVLVDLMKEPSFYKVFVNRIRNFMLNTPPSSILHTIPHYLKTQADALEVLNASMKLPTEMQDQIYLELLVETAKEYGIFHSAKEDLNTLACFYRAKLKYESNNS